MSSPWLIKWFHSTLILLEELSLSMDPMSMNGGGDVVLITHAHGDHVAGFRSKSIKICSSPTAELYLAYYRKDDIAGEVKLLDPPSYLKLDDLRIEPKEAGHILGSNQFLLSHPSYGLLVYTGDLNVEGSIVSRPAEFLKCDELIIDTTFGHPSINFPPRERLYEEIVSWVKRVAGEGCIAMLYAYPLGKAQELVKLLNEYASIEPMVHSTIARVNKVYERTGVKLRYVMEDLCREFKDGSRGGIYILPIRCFKPDVKLPKAYRAIFTGWAAKFSFSCFEKAFPLSSHSPYPLLMEYIAQTGARRVYTLGRYAREASKQIQKKLEIKAYPLSEEWKRME